MAMITPNSVIQMFTGVPLNKDGEDTIFFATRAYQDTFFNGLSNVTLSDDDYTYIKEKENLRVQSPIGTIQNCNYMRFKNTSYGNKWFYAFVTGTAYINDQTTEVSFEIDPLQTWLPNIDYRLNECRIARQTELSDNIGDNVDPEPLAIPKDYVNKGLTERTFHPRYFCLMISQISGLFGIGTYNVFNTYYDNLPCGYVIAGFDISEPTDMQLLANTLSISNVADNIIGSFMLTNESISATDDPDTWYDHQVTFPGQSITLHLLKDSLQSNINLDDITISMSSIADIDGYVPLNNKLFCYPFSAIKLENTKGQYNLYAIDRFTDRENGITFKKMSNFTPPQSVSIIPRNYNSQDVSQSMERDNLVSEFLLNLPISSQGGFAGGTNAQLFFANMINQLPKIVTSVTTLSSLISNAVGVSGEGLKANTEYVKTSAPDITDIANDYVGFNFYLSTIPASLAREYDQFFNAYGYVGGYIATPLITGRDRFMYVQTVKCNNTPITIPSDAMKTINEKFDSGIRFWKYTTNKTSFSDFTIGDLTSANTITT